MRKKLIILTPLPQFRFGGKAAQRSHHRIDDTMMIQPLRPQLCRAMLDAAKAKGPTDDLLMLLNESDLLFVVQVPARSSKDSRTNVPITLFYPYIASEILNRLHDCFLLFAWVPAPLFMPCWFCAEATAKYSKITRVELLDPGWKYIDQSANLDWRSPNMEPVDVGMGYFGVTCYWARLRRLCQIDQIADVFTDPNRQKGLLESAKEYHIAKAEEFLRAKYGPDVAIGRSPAEARPSDPVTVGDMKMLISPRQMSRWFIKGLSIALAKEVQKHSIRLHTNPSKNRLLRGFQFFSQSFRLVEPHRLVGFATCLETLFCTRRTEVTFQLASRLSWLLEPKDYAKRRDTFKEATNLYDLRSKIVHGGNFAISEIDTQEQRLVELCRRAFWTILEDDRLFDTFFHKDPRVCDEYLDSLNLGCPGPATPHKNLS